MIEALLPDVLPQVDAARILGVPHDPHRQIVRVDHDTCRAFNRAVYALRINLCTLSRVSGVGDMLV